MRTPRPVRSGGALLAAMAVGVVFSAGAHAAPGDLDLTFSGDGKQTTNFAPGGDDGAAAVALQNDGKIVAVGGASGASGENFVLARYNANGSLDTSFSNDGRKLTNFIGPVEGATGVAIQANGKIVVVGFADVDAGPFDFALARYNPNGSPDTSFSGNGRQRTDFGGNDRANGVAIQANGKIVVVGRAADDFALARYKVNGSLDKSFSGDGKQTTDFNPGSFGGASSAGGVALQADGKIVAVGTLSDRFLSVFALARYNPNGSLDTSFSGDGKETTDFGDADGANGVALQADGKIVAVGTANGVFALARYNPNGSPDASFSGDGKQTTGFGGFAGANGVAIEGSGKIVAVGSAGAGSDVDFALARYNPNGSKDTTFSGDGRRGTNFGGDDRATGMALQDDGKIVAVGTGRGPNGTNDFALARYLGG